MSAPRRSQRSSRPPARLDNGGDQLALQQALRKSVLEQRRVVSKVPEAPVFRPTAENFEDFLGYIKRIKPEGEAAGIIKIIPPPGWKPAFNIHTEDKFVTKRQLVHRLQEGVAFDEGNMYTMHEYQERAAAFKDYWLSGHPELQQALEALAICVDDEDGSGARAAAQLIEDAYWQIVERASTEEVTVDYGNDLDAKRYGSGFPTREGSIRTWDLNNLYEQRHSVLSSLGDTIEGVSSPWLYFGMLFTTFCWHNEDHFLYSVNYHHVGAPKTWYGIPGVHAHRFEQAMRVIAPERFREERDLLHQLVTVASPSLLINQGVHVTHALQQEGELIVTFPKAYHCGFSHGWNCAEAANFGTLDWLPYGAEAVEKYCKGPGKRPAVFSHDMLVWELCEDTVGAKRPRHSANPSLIGHRTALKGSSGGHATFNRVAVQELQLRKGLREEGIREMRLVTVASRSSRSDDAPACCVCGGVPFLSHVRCFCRPTEIRCLHHAHRSCTCPWASKVLHVHVADAELHDMRSLLRDMVQQDAAKADPGRAAVQQPSSSATQAGTLPLPVPIIQPRLAIKRSADLAAFLAGGDHKRARADSENTDDVAEPAVQPGRGVGRQAAAVASTDGVTGEDALDAAAALHELSSLRGARQTITQATAALEQEQIRAETMEDAYDQLAQRVLDNLSQAPSTSKYVVGIAGAPGSGKSTLAHAVAARVNMMAESPQADTPLAVAVGMDGFHYYRWQLDKMEDPVEAHAKRGAHWTFDGSAFVECIRTVKTTGQAFIPSFDHGKGDPVLDDIQVLPQTSVVLVEGNYLLLDMEPWSELTSLFDETWFIECDTSAAMERVLLRMTGEMGLTPDVAHWRVANNDNPNAELIALTQSRADVVVPSIPFRQA
ncbi:hypothetical protein WJX72_009620 [[Myrmecia] bisecta]|uniref:Uncharacterized protein n=1 Tax=[Myrmecia] bisecta TaxID=41462 RepID=A0AAW1PTR5_9CHLO